jgi:hypothetical protein
MQHTDIRRCQCASNCGLTWDADLLPSHRKGRKYAVGCPTRNCVAPGPERRCACNVCGLTVTGHRGRKYAPDCPRYDEMQRERAKRVEARRRDRTPGERAESPVEHRVKRTGGKCPECYGLPHRRPEHAACACGEVYTAEQLTCASVARYYVAP